MNKFKSFLVLLISFILQTSIFAKIDIMGANLNIIIPAVIALGQILPNRTGRVGGLIVGLFEDFLFTSLIGVRALSYYLIGVISSGEFIKLGKDKQTGMLICFISTIFNFLLVNGIYYIFGKSLNSITGYLGIEILVEAVFNSLIYLVYYQLIKKIMYIPTYRI
ncbi:rod shape-determining protein MreD [uncultured Anaerococcus sp.]|uniref:rod shape-determining protein MreD n=1 Tax=uncultured Anaerococcus sp. TaxID=293428 RepID=UPI00288BB31C|nr:rod shape-determining protein MreD [uncultured Anaerococcus sp.]